MASFSFGSRAALSFNLAPKVWLRQLALTSLHLAAFYIGVLILAAPGVLLVEALAPADLQLVTRVGLQSISVVLSFAVITMFLRWRGRWSLADIGWSATPNSARGFGAGTAIGAFMAVAAIALGVIGGAGRLTLDGAGFGSYLGAFLPLAGILLFAALAEEVLFRGYPLLKLSKLIGKSGASIMMAVGFAAVHLANPSVSAIGLVNIALASLVLSAIFFTRGGLAAAWGLHLGWNAGLAAFDAPVSGLRFDLPMLDYHWGTPVWLSGAGFGPEGGAAASIVLVASLALIVRRLRTTSQVQLA